MAILDQVLMTFLYVLVLYLPLKDPPAGRDSPRGIQRRMISQTSVMIVAWRRLGPGVVALGSFWRGIHLALISWLILYLGPVILALLDPEQCRDQVWNAAFRDRSPWVKFRDFVYAPVCEEMMFRGCFSAQWMKREESWASMAAITVPSMLFSVAHVHHVVRLGSVVGWDLAWKQVGVQVVCSGVLGMFVGYVFVQTRSVYGAVVVHALCNVVGPPRVDRIGALESGTGRVVAAAGFMLGPILSIWFISAMSER